MADTRQIKRQEQILDAKQKQLERLDRAREMMIKQVEQEAQILEEMLGNQEKLHREMNSEGTVNPNIGSIPVSFKSQHDQFDTGNQSGLKTIGNEGILNDIPKLDINLDSRDQPSYSTYDRSEHWQTLTEKPNVPVYVSGRYVSTGHGSHSINSDKEYEYELSASALPISVGDIVRVPVHPTGHGDGKAFSTGNLRIQINDIYTNKKFHSYHDRIEN